MNVYVMCIYTFRGGGIHGKGELHTEGDPQGIEPQTGHLIQKILHGPLPQAAGQHETGRNNGELISVKFDQARRRGDGEGRAGATHPCRQLSVVSKPNLYTGRWQVQHTEFQDRKA